MLPVSKDNTMKNPNFFKNLAVRLSALLIFFAMMGAVVLYEAGYYDISFIDRPVDITQGSDTEGDNTEGSETVGTDSTTVTGGDTAGSDSSSGSGGQDDPSILDMIISLDEMKKKGYKVSGGNFGSNFSVARLDFDLSDHKSTFSSAKEAVVFQVSVPDGAGIYHIKDKTEKRDIPKVRLYYGMIVIENGAKTTVYNASGKVVVKNFKGQLVYKKSVNGLPVVMIDDEYYELDSLKGLRGKIDGSQLAKTALSFDYSSEYLSSIDGSLTPFMTIVDYYIKIEPEAETTEKPETEEDTQTDTASSGSQESEPPQTEEESVSGGESESGSETVGSAAAREGTESTSEGSADTVASGEITQEQIDKFIEEYDSPYETDVIYVGNSPFLVEHVPNYGYKNSAGKTVISAIYKQVYEFSDEGIAAVVDFKNRMIFIDKKGNTVLSLIDNELIRYNENLTAKARQFFHEPLIKGKESVGTYYFSEGYVMVRYRLRTTYKNRYIQDEFLLINKNGKYFDIPTDFKLYGYSDGRLLLERNGKYGFMDLSGGWTVPAIYSDARAFSQGLAVVGDENGKYGMINTDGELVLPLAFDYVSDPSSGYIATYEKTRGWEIYCTVKK